MVYGVESVILLKDAGLGDPVQVLNAVGARQGDPLGTMLYALVAQPILDEVADACPSVQIEAFADDAGFHGTDHAEVIRAYRLYAHLYSLRLRGELNDSKAVAISLGVTERAARAAGLPPDIPWAAAKLPNGEHAHGGIVLYGAPIGSTDFVRAFLAAAVEEAKAGLERLAHLESSQHKLIMLRMSFCRKIQHVQRLVPTADHADILQDYDDHLVAAVEDLLVGRGRFTELAALKVHIPAALGGLGVESVKARADACYYSSFTCAYLRLPGIDPDWHDGELYRSVESGLHGPQAAYAAARLRLCATPGMAALMEKLTVHDRPRRAQGKIMNLIHAVDVGDLVRTLDPREATVIHASAEAPHLVSISAGGDPNLQVPNEVLATHLAQRLSVTQLPAPPSTGAAMTTHRCPACGQDHHGTTPVNAHLDGCISCGQGGTALRTLWHDDVARVLHATAKMAGVPSVLEPASIAVDSNIRADIKLSNVSARHANQYVDVITYEHTKPTTWGKEAALPGFHCDAAESAKQNKHYASVVASDQRNAFTPVAVNEHGQIGPRAIELVDLIASRTHDPVALKTYTMRRLAVVTATHVHRQLHGRPRGHLALAPAAQRAADPGPHDMVEDDVTEQTVCADDAMTEEERRTAQGRRRPTGVPAGAGVPAGEPDEVAVEGACGHGDGGWHAPGDEGSAAGMAVEGGPGGEGERAAVLGGGGGETVAHSASG
jgi:hypothetical protein